MTKNRDFIKLYIADVSALENQELYDLAYGSVSPARRKKTDNLKQPNDKCLSLGAGCLLNYALATENISNYKITYGEHGKPELDCGLNISISHSGKYALCAISDHAVGCDIEKVDTANLKVAKRFFTEREYEMLTSAGDDIDTLFYRLWTMKESLIKLTGLGISQALDSFEIDVCKGSTLYNDIIYHFYEYEIDDNYRCSACSDASCSATLISVDLKNDILFSLY